MKIRLAANPFMYDNVDVVQMGFRLVLPSANV